MSSAQQLTRALDDLWLVADGHEGPRAVDSVTGIENYCKACLDDQLVGATSLLFSAPASTSAAPSASAAGPGSEQRRTIPSILRHSLTSEGRNKPEVQSLRQELLRFMEAHIEEYTVQRKLPLHQVAEYAQTIVEVCIRVFRGDSQSGKVRELSFHPLLLALELEPDAPDRTAFKAMLFPPMAERDRQRNPSIVQVYWENLCKSESAAGNNATVRGHCMRILGKLGSLFPVEAGEDPIYEKGQLYRQCLDVFEARTEKKAPEQSGALEGIDGVLHVIEPTQDQIRSVWERMIECLRMMEEAGGDLKRYTVPRSALNLLGRHLSLFACDNEEDGRFHGADERLRHSLLLAHVEDLWQPLLAFADHHNRDFRNIVGDLVRDALAALGRLLCEASSLPRHQARAREVYAFLRGKVSALVSEGGGGGGGGGGGAGRDGQPRDEGGRRVALTLRYLGALAGPMRIHGDEALLRQQLHVICARADALFQHGALRHVERARRGAEINAQQLLSVFLEAFAQVLGELSAVDPYTMETLHGLLQLVVRQFPSLGLVPVQRRRNAAALQQLLVSLLPKGDAVRQLLQRFVYQALLVTTLSNDAATRREYVNDLWLPLLDPSERAQTHWGGFRRRGGRDGALVADGATEDPRRFAVCDRIFGELMQSLVQMLHKFDLGAMPAEDDDDEADAADEAAPAAADADAAADATEEASRPGEARMVAVGGRAKVNNAADLTLFLSLIEVCEALLPNVTARMLLAHAHVLSLELVDRSCGYPHISGFYKLIRLVVVACEASGYFDAAAPPPASSSAAMEVDGEPEPAAGAGAGAGGGNPNIERCYSMLATFLCALLQRVKRFSDELQASAMGLLLSAPLRFVAQQTADSVHVLALALSVGHAYKPLAQCAVGAFEAWLRSSAVRPLLLPHLPRVLPSLQVYLSISTDAAEGEASGRKDQVAGKARLVSRQGRRDASASLRAMRSTDEELQLRIVRLLGAVGGESTCIVDGGGGGASGGGGGASGSGGGAGGLGAVTERVCFEMPLPKKFMGKDRVWLHLDAVLPRVVELATTSVQYREKAAACELLDAVIKLCIGINKSYAGARDKTQLSDDFTAQYRHLFPAMLRLATDADSFARQLFEPLSFQVIHWMTSNTQADNSQTMALLDAIMGALSDDAHAGQREFGARCLSELVKYSIKHNRSGSKGAHNVHSLLRRLFGMARHPAPLQRLGYAFALNSTYRQLREDKGTLDSHLLEICEKTFFALQLAQSDPPSLGTAQALEDVVAHLQKILLRPWLVAMLLKPNPDRTAFAAGLAGRDGFVHWLFRGCAQTKARARLQCCEMLEAVVLVLPKAGGGGGKGGGPCFRSSQEWARAEFTNLRDLPLCRRVRQSGGADGDADLTPWRDLGRVPAGGFTAVWLEQVQAALDCTYRALSKGWLTAEALLDPKGTLRDVCTAARALFGAAAAGGGATDVSPGAGTAIQVRRGARSDDSTVALQRQLRETLRSALRLVDKVVRMSPTDARLGGLVDGVSTGVASEAGAQQCAMLAVLRPVLLGFDPSQLAECADLRALACSVCVRLHRRSPATFCAALKAMLQQPAFNLAELRVGDADGGGADALDALELLGLVEGHRSLLLADRSNGPLPEQPLLQAALSGGPNVVAEHLANLALCAGADTPALLLKLLSTALELAFELGLSAFSVLNFIQDPMLVVSARSGGADATATATAATTTRGELFVQRFQPVLVANIAKSARPDDYGPLLMLGTTVRVPDEVAAQAQRQRMLHLLLAVLDHFSTEEGRPLPAEPMVASLDAALPQLLAHERWPNQREFDSTLLLLRRLAGLGGRIVLGGPHPDGPGRLLDGVLAIFRPIPWRADRSVTAAFAQRAKVEAMKMLPLLLRWLRLGKAPHATQALMSAVRDELSSLPSSFHELADTTDAQALLMPLLDAISDPELRSLELLEQLLSLRCCVEQPVSGAEHAFAAGIQAALRAFVEAVCRPGAAAGGAGAGASAADLFALCARTLFDNGAAARGGWEQRQAVLHWIALPLVHAAAATSSARLVELVEPGMKPLVDTYLRAHQEKALPSQEKELHLELVGRTAAFELLAALTSLVPKAEFEPSGRLAVASGHPELRKQIPSSCGKAAKDPLKLPGGQLTNTVAAHLARRYHAAAYSALVEYIVATQTVANKLVPVLFTWKSLWENALDTQRRWDLKAETNFAPAKEAEQLGLHSRAKAKAAPSGGKYFASQALSSSSLSQDIDLLDDVAPAPPPLRAAVDDDAPAPDAAAEAEAEARAAEAAAAAQNAAFLRPGDKCLLSMLQPTDKPPESAEKDVIVLEADGSAAGVLVATGGGPKGEDQGALWAAACTLKLGEGSYFRNVLEIEYELDELNQEPLMRVLLRCIDSLRMRGLEGTHATGMPLWMQLLLSKFNAPALLKAGDQLQLEETDGAMQVKHLESGRVLTPWAKVRATGDTLQRTLQGVRGRWGEFIDLGKSVQPPLPPLVRPGDALKVLGKDNKMLQHVPSGQRLKRTDKTSLAANTQLVVPPQCATMPGATMTLPEGASFVNPETECLILNPSASAHPVQLLIAKLVHNRQSLFMPHARHWVAPLLQVVFDSLSDPAHADKEGKHCLHYLARDLLQMVCSWPAEALPADEASNTLVSDLLDKLLQKCEDDNNSLLRENVRIIKGLIEHWKPRLTVRRRMIFSLLSAKMQDDKMEQRFRTTGLHLLNVLVANDIGIADDPAQTTGMAGKPYPPVSCADMLQGVLRNVVDERKDSKKPRKALYVPASQLLGQALAQVREKDGAAATETIEMRIEDHLSAQPLRTEEGVKMFCELLDCLSQDYPAVLLVKSAGGGGVSFGQKALKLFTDLRVFGEARVKVINCLSRCLHAEAAPPAGDAMDTSDGSAPKQEKLVLESAEGQRALKQVVQQPEAACQLAAVRLCTALCKTRGVGAVLPLLSTMDDALSANRHVGVRRLYYELLIALHKHDGELDDESRAQVRAALVRGLSDADDAPVDASASAAEAALAAVAGGEEVGAAAGGPGTYDDKTGMLTPPLREAMTHYWHSARLPPQLELRLLSCFESLHAPPTEREWVQDSCTALLRVAADSAQYEAAMFGQLDPDSRMTEWRVRPTAGSQSLAMQPWGTQSQSQFSQLSQASQSQSQDGAGEGMLWATQAALFSQTQDANAAPRMASTYSSQGAAGTLLFAPKRTAAAAAVPRFDDSGAADGAGGGGGGGGTAATRGVKSLRIRANGAFSADNVRERNRRRAEGASEAGRAQKVRQLRSYRTGEVPDVAIKPRDLLAPLALLVRHDPLIAKDMLVRLWGVVLGLMNGGESTDKKLCDGVKQLLRSQGASSAFVGCLHELALSRDDVASWLLGSGGDGGDGGDGDGEDDARRLAATARKSGNLHSGVRLLEACLLGHEGRAASTGGGGKRGRTSGGAGDARAPPDALELCLKMQLIELYAALGEEDIVRGLSAEVARQRELPKLQDALAKQARGDAKSSLQLFDETLDALRVAGRGGSGEHALAQSGRQGCLLQLSRWSELRDEMREKMGAVVGGAQGGGEQGGGGWEAHSAEPWLRMWLASHCKLSAEAKDTGWGHWPSSPAGAPQPGGRDQPLLLDDGFGAYLALDRLAEDDVNGASVLLVPGAKAFVARWATLHPLATAARRQELQPLQLMSEIGEMIALVQDRKLGLLKELPDGRWELSAALRGLFSSWGQRTPSTLHHAVSVWDDLLCCRKRLLTTLEAKLDGAIDDNGIHLEDDREALTTAFGAAKRDCLLGLQKKAARAAREQGNFAAAQKYLEGIVKQMKDANEARPLALKCEVVKLKHEMGRAQHVPGAGAGGAAAAAAGGEGGSAWRAELHKVRDSAETLARMHAADSTPAERATLAMLQATVSWDLAEAEAAASGGGVLSAEAARLAMAAVETMGRAVEAAGVGELTPAEMAALRLKLADCCESAAATQPDHAQRLTALAAEQVFQAMSDDHSSDAARNRLVAAIAGAGKFAPLRPKLAEWVLKPPSWMALGWVGQLVAMLNEEHGECAVELLVQLAEKYPQAVYSPFQCSRDELEAKRDRGELGRRQAEALRRLSELLVSPAQERLARALMNLHQPHIRFRELKMEVQKCLDQGDGEAAQRCYLKYRAAVLAPTERPDPRGKFLVEFASRFGARIDALYGKDGGKLLPCTSVDAGKAFLKSITANLSKLLQEVGKAGSDELRSSKAAQISSYSSYLKDYHRASEVDDGPLSGMELPGQYTGRAEPQVELHVHFDCVEEKLLVLGSKQAPKRIMVQCSDQTERRFLVKAGEDLRLDQRVQQMMGLMNATLDASTSCASRGLRMRTYAVAPLNSQVGILEWMERTTTLKDFCKDAVNKLGDTSMVDKAVKAFERADIDCNANYGNKPKQFMQKMKTERREKSAERLRAWQTICPNNLLGKGIMQQASGAEAYLTMRSTFASSLAALTIAQYILGIGDRHTENFMVEPATGRAIAIDFGMAFGHATYTLPVPELMPFRLTNIFTSFLRPLDSSVLLTSAMVHTLGALRARRHDLLRVMEVFVAEPLLDWEAVITKLSDKQVTDMHVDAEEAATAASAVAASSAVSSVRGGGGTATTTTQAAEDLRAFAKTRMAGVEQRLSGGNSARITMSELQYHINYASDKEQMKAFEGVVLGPADSVRRALPEGGLTTEQQIDCLVEHAQDPVILGWAFPGWTPWL